MKAVVMHREGEYVYALCDDGVVRKVRRTGDVGDTFEYRPQTTTFPARWLRRAAAVATVFVLLVTLGVLELNSSVRDFSYVTLDVNPSFEYVLNRRGRVLRVEALNEDAERLMGSLKQGESDLSAAIGETTALLYETGYLGDDKDNVVLIGVASRGEAESKNLTETIETYCQTTDASVQTVVTVATVEEFQQARELGISAGKYKLMEEALGVSGTLTKDDVASMETLSIKEIVARRDATMESKPAATVPASPVPAEPDKKPSEETRPEPVKQPEAPKPEQQPEVKPEPKETKPAVKPAPWIDPNYDPPQEPEPVHEEPVTAPVEEPVQSETPETPETPAVE